MLCCIVFKETEKYWLPYLNNRIIEIFNDFLLSKLLLKNYVILS